MEPPDLLFQIDLKHALRQPGCPVCRLLREADRHYLMIFLREGKDDGRMLLRLLGSWGLCARHAKALIYLDPVEHGDGLGIGTLYDWLLTQARKRLEGLRQELAGADASRSILWRRNWKPGRNVQSRLQRIVQRGLCPACEAQEWQADYVTERFFRALEAAVELSEISALYLASDGLCLPHWRAMGTCQPSAAVTALVSEKQQQVRASLKSALETVFTDRAYAEAGMDGAGSEGMCATALAAVAGDTRWKPPAKSARSAR